MVQSDNLCTEFIFPYQQHLPVKQCCLIQSSLLETLYTEPRIAPLLEVFSEVHCLRLVQVHPLILLESYHHHH